MKPYIKSSKNNITIEINPCLREYLESPYTPEEAHKEYLKIRNKIIKNIKKSKLEKI